MIQDEDVTYRPDRNHICCLLINLQCHQGSVSSLIDGRLALDGRVAVKTFHVATKGKQIFALNSGPAYGIYIISKRILSHLTLTVKESRE